MEFSIKTQKEHDYFNFFYINCTEKYSGPKNEKIKIFRIKKYLKKSTLIKQNEPQYTSLANSTFDFSSICVLCLMKERTYAIIDSRGQRGGSSCF